MTKDQESFIIDEYLKGATAVEISKKIGLSNSTISRFVKKIGISRGGFSKKRLDNEKNIVDDFINNKMYCEELAKKYEMNVHTIYTILDKYGIERQTGYHSNCNEQYFENIDNPHKAYLLGFITADGAIANEVLSIEIHEDDIELLNFAKEQINPKATLTKVKGRNTIKVTFGAKKIAKDLSKYGIIQNKSKIIKNVPVEFIQKEFLPFYFRGLIDGDGSISKEGKISIYSGSRDFIEDVQRILVEETGVSKLRIYEGTTYFISWSSKQDKKILFNYLYSNLNDTFFYKRKYERLKNYIENCNNANIELTS